MMAKIYLKNQVAIKMIRHIKGALNDSAFEPFETTVGECKDSGFFENDRGTMVWSAEITQRTEEMKSTAIERDKNGVYVDGFDQWELV